MAGRGRGWRGEAPTPEGMRCLNALRGGEQPSSVIATSAGLSQASVIQKLKTLEGHGYVSSRLESVKEHQAREKEPHERNKGQRRTYWKLTRAGETVVNG